MQRRHRMVLGREDQGTAAEGDNRLFNEVTLIQKVRGGKRSRVSEEPSKDLRCGGTAEGQGAG